jgi:hypothetical protein
MYARRHRGWNAGAGRDIPALERSTIMSQVARRLIASSQRLDPPPGTDADIPERLRIRRFSEGVERAVLDHFRVPRIGSFGTGRRRLDGPVGDSLRIGRFSRGQDHLREDDPLALHVGRFDDVSR